MKKAIIIFSIMFLTISLKIISSEAVENRVDNKQIQNLTNYEVEELKNKMKDFESSIYQRVLEDAKISLDSSRQATSLVSVASYIFILISFLLGYLGFREWRNISKLRKNAEKEINLIRHYNLAEMYLRNGITSVASKEFEEVLKIDPNNLIAHTQLGFLYTDIFKEKAIMHCKKVVELDPNNFVAYLNWGVNLDHTTAPKNEVLRIYETAERLGEEQRIDDVSLGKVKRFIADCYKTLGERSRALSKYKEAKEKLERAKSTGIPEVVNLADHWLKGLDSMIKELENKV